MIEAVCLAFLFSAFYVTLIQLAVVALGNPRWPVRDSFRFTCWGAAGLLLLAWSLRMLGL